MNGTVVLPSLDRPHLLKEFIDSYNQTDSSVPGMIVIDENDFKKHESAYLALDLPKGWSLVKTKGVTMGDKFRELWNDIKDLDWVMILNDDHRPRTSGWDRKILSQITGSNIVATNDGPDPQHPWMAPNKLCGAICYSGKVLRAVGWMHPPGMQHLYHDDVWGQLCGRAQCGQIIMDVCVEHVHAYKDPSKQDETYKKVNSEKSWKGDKEVFEKWMKNDFENDVKKLIAIQPRQGIMIATPFHDGTNVADYTTGIMDIALKTAQQNIYFEFARVIGSSLIPHARNTLVSYFLNSKCQRLLFIDSDQGFHAGHVLSLMNSTRPIIGGVTPHKRYPLNLNFEPLPADAKYFKEIANKSNEEFFKYVKERADSKGEIEVNRIGTGFMMIDRSVFEIMSEHVKEYEPFDDRKDVLHREFFKMGEYKGIFRGEDWYFTELAKSLDIPIYINTNVLVSHSGTHQFLIDESKRLV